MVIPSDALLAALPPGLQTLARRGEQRHYRARTLLIQEGDQGDTLYIILDGRLRAFSADAQGKELTYGVYGPGEYLGEMSLDGGPRSASVETLEPSCCVVVTRQALLTHIGEHPDFALELLAKVIRRARSATHSARQLALNDVYGRLRHLLDSLAGAPDAMGGRVLGEHLSHRQLAEHLGCSREMVSRLMKDLERGGYIRPSRTRLELLRPLPARW